MVNSFYPELFKPGYIGSLWVRNRIVMAPMATNFTHINGEVSEALIAHYSARARGGVGLIIVEAASVAPLIGNEGCGQLHISHPRFVPGLNRLNEAMKAFGSRTFIQLFHAGRQTTSLLCGGDQPVAPSAIPCSIMKSIPRELTTMEVKQIVKEFISAAHNAYKAGFDGIELHAAHGYLINQFLSPHTNKRQDEYGGSLENRQRFLIEIVSGIKMNLPHLAMSVRLNIDDFIEGGFELAESLKVCKRLEESGVDIINCSCGTYESGLKSIEPASYEEGWRVYLAEAVKKVVDIPVITGGMIRRPDFANKVLADKKADFVFLGRSLLADPEWANKVRKNNTADIRPCITCNNCIDNNFKGLGIRCTVNPFTGRENIIINSRAVKQHAKAVIAGGGPAGMQTAISLRRRGFDVILYEKQSKLGGFMNLAGVPPYKEQIIVFRDYMIRELNKSGAEVVLNQEFTRDMLLNMKPDILILATGSTAVHPAIEGCNLSTCVEAVDVLDEKIKLVDKEILIIGGGSTGCETADFLIEAKNRVTIVEKSLYLAADMERKSRRELMNRLKDAGVKTKTGVQVLDINSGNVRTTNAGTEETLSFDYVVWAAGFRPKEELFSLAQEITPFVFLIGDASKVRGFKDAILEGEMLGNTICALLN